jgi:predicted permease
MRASALYRALLRFYPARFRQEFGDEMAHAFAAQLREAQRERRRLAVAAIWAAALRDLAPTALREHRHVMHQDLRHALRILVANPGFTAVAVLSLALGIGANTAIFSLLNGVLMSTLPVRNPHELVMLTDPGSRGVAIGGSTGERALLTYGEFQRLQTENRTFASLLASSSSLERTHARIAGGEPEEVAIRLVSASYFAALGVPAFVGQTFDPRSEPAQGAAPYAVISHEFWQRRFGGRADVVGRIMTFRGGAVSVVGVAPASFFGETVGERPDAWIPLAMLSTVAPGRNWLPDESPVFEKVMWLHAFGRLAPGVTIERAQQHANLVFRQGLEAYYSGLANVEDRRRFVDQHLTLRPAATGASFLRQSFSEPLFVLLGAAALVLLIACANLGNLLLARTTARSREMSVRLALGAGRGRLVRQLLTESLSLAAIGGVVGLVVAVLLRAGLLRLVGDAAISLPATIDLRTAAFVVGVTLAAGVFLGLLPALRTTQAQAVAGLREQGRGIAGSAAWLRVGKAVVIGQLALSLPLLVGAGLLARTLVNLQRVDLGYPKDGVLTVNIDAQPAAYDPVRKSDAFGRLLTRIQALPGVRVASYSNNGLFAGSDNGDQIVVEGYTSKGDNDRGSRYDAVGPGYFSTLGIPIVLGREITEQDRAGGPMVCVINETFAKRFFAGRHPLGLHVTQVYGDQRNTYEIVGVVRDSRQNRLRGEIEHRFYTPATQPAAGLDAISFIIRPRGEGGQVLADVRRVIQQDEPRMAIGRVGAVGESVDRRLVQDRLLAQLSIAFGGVAVLLAAIGLYGVLSYGVARRTNEIGVRKALGAQSSTLMAMILRETGWLVLVGLVVGCAAAIGASRLIASRLYGLSPTDPVTLAAAIAGLALVAVLAAWLPAWRASRVDPLVALRCE